MDFLTFMVIMKFLNHVFWLDKDDLSDPEFRLDELMHLAELCIEVTQQNDEYHSEVRVENDKKNDQNWGES